jgi:fumarylpyruvate hydrolase
MFLLQAGDLIFTGTPAGVGPVEIGDEVNATLTGLPELNFKVV